MIKFHQLYFIYVAVTNIHHPIKATKADIKTRAGGAEWTTFTLARKM